MPRIAVKNLDNLRQQQPREYSLVFELGGSADGIDSQVLPNTFREMYCAAESRAPVVSYYGSALTLNILCSPLCRPCWRVLSGMAMWKPCRSCWMSVKVGAGHHWQVGALHHISVLHTAMLACLWRRHDAV